MQKSRQILLRIIGNPIAKQMAARHIWGRSTVNRKTNGREFKELRDSQCNPLGVSKRNRFGLPTGEGASQEWEVGGGMFLLRSKGLPLVVARGAKPPGFCMRKAYLA